LEKQLTDSSASPTSTPAPVLGRVFQAFVDPKVESDFRNESHVESRRHEQLGVLLFVLVTIFFAIHGVISGAQEGFITFPFVPRVLMALIAIAYWVKTRNNRYTPGSDLIAALLVTLLGAMILWIESTRGPSYLGHAGLDVLFILIVYLIIPIPLTHQTVVAVLYSVGEYLLLRTMRTSLDPLSLYVVSMGLLNANIVGFLFARRIGRLNRERYIAFRQELEARTALEAAMAEVKTLSGLLPICCVCKKIRDDSGYWSNVESYLHNHLHQQLTHGLCPECFEEQTKELRDAYGEDAAEK